MQAMQTALLQDSAWPERAREPANPKRCVGLMMAQRWGVWLFHRDNERQWDCMGSFTGRVEVADWLGGHQRAYIRQAKSPSYTRKQRDLVTVLHLAEGEYLGQCMREGLRGRVDVIRVSIIFVGLFYPFDVVLWCSIFISGDSVLRTIDKQSIQQGLA